MGQGIEPDSVPPFFYKYISALDFIYKLCYYTITQHSAVKEVTIMRGSRKHRAVGRLFLALPPEIAGRSIEQKAKETAKANESANTPRRQAWIYEIGFINYPSQTAN